MNICLELTVLGNLLLLSLSFYFLRTQTTVLQKRDRDHKYPIQQKHSKRPGSFSVLSKVTNKEKVLKELELHTISILSFWEAIHVCMCVSILTRVSVQFSHSCVWLFATPQTATHQDSLSSINSQSMLKIMSIELVMQSNHFIL